MFNHTRYFRRLCYANSLGVSFYYIWSRYRMTVWGFLYKNSLNWFMQSVKDNAINVVESILRHVPYKFVHIIKIDIFRSTPKKKSIYVSIISDLRCIRTKVHTPDNKSIINEFRARLCNYCDNIFFNAIHTIRFFCAQIERFTTFFRHYKRLLSNI